MIFAFLIILAAVPLLAIIGKEAPPAVSSIPTAATASAATETATDNSTAQAAAAPTALPSSTKAAADTVPAATKPDIKDETVTVKDKYAGSFKIYDESTKTVTEVPDKEFCLGALAAAMDTSCEPSALKAQTVALYSYYSFLRTQNRENPKNDMQGADFDCNSKIWSVYTTKDNIKEKWGNSFDKDFSKIENAVNDVFGTVVTYKGTMAKTEFCAMNSGITESGKDIYGDDSLPYLTNVASPYDTMENNFKTTLTLSSTDFNDKIKRAYSDFLPQNNLADIVSDISRTQAGSVLKITLWNKEFTGEQIANLFNLRSRNFTLKFADGSYTFTVLGYGSGVGLSQSGANAMAKQGADAKEILSYYYPNTVLGQLVK